jgi:hypothetical protein
MNRSSKKTIVTPQMTEDMIRDHYEKGLTISDLARKYNINYRTAKDRLEKYSYGFTADSLRPVIVTKIVDMTPEVHPVIEERRKMSASKRDEEFKKDALEVTELAVIGFKELLEDSNKRKMMSASQLASIMQAVAPYTMSKPDGKDKGKNKEKSAKEFLSGIIHKSNAKENPVQRN